jgi:hypothetical protein
MRKLLIRPRLKISTVTQKLVACSLKLEAFLMGVLKQLAEYLYLRKKDPNRPKDKWIGYMHGINRISILVFLLCLIILAIKLLR